MSKANSLMSKFGANIAQTVAQRPGSPPAPANLPPDKGQRGTSEGDEMRAILAARLNHRVRAFAFVTVAVAASAASVFAFGAKAEPPWGPETPPFNLEVILRDVTGGQGSTLV